MYKVLKATFLTDSFFHYFDPNFINSISVDVVTRNLKIICTFWALKGYDVETSISINTKIIFTLGTTMIITLLKS